MANPYLKNKTFLKRKRKVGAEVSSIANKPNSNEKYVGNNGEFNAGSGKELLQVLSMLQQEISNGNVLNPKTESRHQKARKIAADHKEVITAAFVQRNDEALMTLAQVVGDEIITAGEREGFAVNLLTNKDLGAGEIARFKVREKQVTGFQPNRTVDHSSGLCIS